MKSQANGIHENDGSPKIMLRLVNEKDGVTTWACTIDGDLGILTVTSEDGEPSGWDWEGPEQTDEDLQRALDCTELHFLK